MQLFGCPSTSSAPARAFYGSKLSLLLVGGACWGAGQCGAERPVMCGAGLSARCCGGGAGGGAGRLGRAHQVLLLTTLG